MTAVAARQGESSGAIAGPVTATSIRMAKCQIIEMAGMAMTKQERHEFCPYCVVACLTFQLHEKLLT